MTNFEYITAVYQSEKLFTAATCRYINANYPHLRHFFFHVPNESATSNLMRMQLASMGVLAGVPDFVFLLPNLLFLELKMPGNQLSPKQKALHELWFSKGIPVETAWSAKEVCIILGKYLK